MERSEATEKEINRWRGQWRPGRRETKRRLAAYHREKAREARKAEDEVWSWVGSNSVKFDDHYCLCPCQECAKSELMDFSQVIWSCDQDQFIEYTDYCMMNYPRLSNYLQIKPIQVYARIGVVKGSGIEWYPSSNAKTLEYYCRGGLKFEIPPGVWWNGSVIIECPRYHAKYVELFLQKKGIQYHCAEQSYLDLINPKVQESVTTQQDLSIVGRQITLYPREAYDWRQEYESYSAFLESKYDDESDLGQSEMESESQWVPETSNQIDVVSEDPYAILRRSYCLGTRVDSPVDGEDTAIDKDEDDNYESDTFDEVALPLPVESDQMQNNQVRIHLAPLSPVRIYWENADYQSEVITENLRLTPEPIPIEEDIQEDNPVDLQTNSILIDGIPYSEGLLDDKSVGDKSVGDKSVEVWEYLE